MLPLAAPAYRPLPDDPLPHMLRRDPALLPLLLSRCPFRALAAWLDVAEQFRGRPGYNGLPLPTPTAALPGTPEKVEEMMLRAARKQAVFSPRDRTWEEAAAERAGLVEDETPSNGGNHRSAIGTPQYSAARTTGRRVVQEGTCP